MYLSYPAWFPSSLEKISRKVPAGQTVTFNVTLYFGPPGIHPYILANETISKWVAQRPFIINWSDRRPLAMDVLAVAETEFHSASNPRGWFGDTSVDVYSTSGKANFRSRLLGRADTIIGNCQTMVCS